MNRFLVAGIAALCFSFLPLHAGKTPASTKAPVSTKAPASTPAPLAQGGSAKGTSSLPPSAMQQMGSGSDSTAGKDPYQFERFGVTAANANEIDRAREFFQKSWELGELPTAPFNLACLDVRQGKIDAAFKNLDRAIAAGFDEESILMSDNDLESIRGKAEFSTILAGVRKNREIGDAAVVKEGLFVGPEGSQAKAILVLFHDASSDPMTVSSPFIEDARARGFYVAVPRGPSRVGRKRFGWGPARRALKAAESALEEARRRTGLTKVPVMLVGVGRGGVLAFNVAMRKPGTFAGVGSIGGAFSPEGEGQNREAIKAGLRGTRLFIGVVDGADQSLVAAIRKSRDGLRYLGLQVSYSEWPGKGPMFPDDTKKAVRELLDAVSGQNPG